MIGELELARWPYGRVLPLGERWVEDDWLPAATAMLAAASRS